MELQLKVLSGRHAGKVLKIRGSQFLIGRSAECQLRLTTDLVSRRHCQITQDEAIVAIRDLGSRNGTYVNGEAIVGDRRLAAGDHIKIGPVVFEAILPVMATAATVDSRPTTGEDLFDVDALAWLSSAPDQRPHLGALREIERERIAKSDTVCLQDGDTVDMLDGAKIKAKLAEEEAKAKASRKPGKSPPPRFVFAKPSYADSSSAAAETIQRFFQRRS